MRRSTVRIRPAAPLQLFDRLGPVGSLSSGRRERVEIALRWDFGRGQLRSRGVPDYKLKRRVVALEPTKPEHSAKTESELGPLSRSERSCGTLFTCFERHVMRARAKGPQRNKPLDI